MAVKLESYEEHQKISFRILLLAAWLQMYKFIDSKSDIGPVYLAETIITKTTEETQENRFCLRPIFSSCNPVDKGEGVISFGNCAQSHCVYTIKYDQTKPIL